MPPASQCHLWPSELGEAKECSGLWTTSVSVKWAAYDLKSGCLPLISKSKETAIMPSFQEFNHGSTVLREGWTQQESTSDVSPKRPLMSRLLVPTVKRGTGNIELWLPEGGRIENWSCFRRTSCPLLGNPATHHRNGPTENARVWHHVGVWSMKHLHDDSILTSKERDLVHVFEPLDVLGVFLAFLL